MAAVQKGEVKPGDAIVLRYMGPKGGPGMPDCFGVAAAVVGAQLDAPAWLVTLLALLLFVLLIGLGVGLLPYSFIFAALIMFSFVASITTYLTYPAIEARVMRREEGHAAGELYQTLPQQEQPEVQLRSAGLDELRFEDDETEENAEN